MRRFYDDLLTAAAATANSAYGITDIPILKHLITSLGNYSVAASLLIVVLCICFKWNNTIFAVIFT